MRALGYIADNYQLLTVVSLIFDENDSHFDFDKDIIKIIWHLWKMAKRLVGVLFEFPRIEWRGSVNGTV